MHAGLYRTIWRWHFYAGLFVVPFILILAITGTIYLFKPDLDRWEERGFRSLGATGSVSADAQLAAVLAAHPSARWQSYRLPERVGDAAVIRVATASGQTRDVYVSPQGRVLATVDPARRISAWIGNLHGSLLAGAAGRLLVELAASWAIVLLLTGLFLWWPRGRGPAGVIWPRLNRGIRAALRDLHAVTGFWVSGLALVLLLTALPWTDAWATAFRAVRAELGWVREAQQWKGGVTLHAAHHPATAHHPPIADTALAGTPPLPLSVIVARASREAMPAPAVLLPPHAPQPFGPPNGPDWKLTSQTQNRPQIRSVSFDATSGAVTGRQDFADKHPIDQVIGIGIAWHEGQLFGRINQAIGVLTAIGLMTLAVTGTWTWWRRRPAGSGLGAPPAWRGDVRQRGAIMAIAGLGLLLPMLGASLLAILAGEAAWRRWLSPAP